MLVLLQVTGCCYRHFCKLLIFINYYYGELFSDILCCQGRSQVAIIFFEREKGTKVISQTLKDTKPSYRFIVTRFMWSSAKYANLRETGSMPQERL